LKQVYTMIHGQKNIKSLIEVVIAVLLKIHLTQMMGSLFSGSPVAFVEHL